MVKMIFAVEEETGLIGDNGKMPWYFREDMKFFRETTRNKLVLCGRSTFDHIPELPERSIIVCTRDKDIRQKTSKRIDFVVDDIEAFFKTRKFDGIDIYIIGGAKIYQQVAPYADELIVTSVRPPRGMHFEGDSFIFYYQRDFKLASFGDTVTCENLKEGPMKGVKCELTVQRWVRK